LIKRNYDNEIVRGAGYNLLGVLGRAFTPMFFIVVGRMHGADTLGVFILVFVFIELIKRLVVGGLNDGIMIFTAKHLVRDNGEQDAYRVIANSIVLCVGLGILPFVATELDLFRVLPMYSTERVQDLMSLMALGIPLQATAALLVAATKAHVEMKWDALLGGFIRPFGLCFFAVLFFVLDFGTDGLGFAYAATGVVMLAVSLFIFFKYFSFKKLMYAFRCFRLSRELLYFVVPQNLHLSCNDMIAGFDVMMLGFFGVRPALIGYYGVAAQIMLNIQQVWLAFSGVYTPVIARLHGEKRLGEMNISFNKVSRWIMLIAFPIGFLVIFFRRELLHLFHPGFSIPLTVPMNEMLPEALISILQIGYFSAMGETSFMIALALVPFLSCAFGLSMNVLIAVGKSGWSLFNSALVAFLSLLFASLLIPEYGLFGAAFAAALAAVCIRSIQVIEAWFLVGVRLIPSKVYKPYLAALIAGVLLFFADSMEYHYFGLRLLAIVSVLGVYFALLKGLTLEEDDIRILMPWRK
jgi:O-antigen/teichoic acid export membrane protein